MRARRRLRRLVVLYALAAACLVAIAAPAQAARNQESLFQDDSLLVFKSASQVARTHTDDDGRLVPRVSSWALWNEPNGIHFLAPVWQRHGGTWVESGAVMYRALVDAGWKALLSTGHVPGDAVLVGETAPKAKPG